MRFLLLFVLLAVVHSPVLADSHEHGPHHAASETAEPVERPRVFLDKSRRVVDYQLKRLDLPRLLLVERDTSDAKYVPVYEAILTRPGVPAAVQEEAIAALETLSGVSRSVLLLGAVESLGEEAETDRLRRQLALRAVAAVTPGEHDAALFETTGRVLEGSEEVDDFTRALVVAMAIRDGRWPAATGEPVGRPVDRLRAVRLLPPEAAAPLADEVAAALEGTEPEQIAALWAIERFPQRLVAELPRIRRLLENETLRPHAVDAIASLPAGEVAPQQAGAIASQLVALAEATPAAKRTSDAFLRLAALADQLFARLPVAEARELRGRLQEVAVRVVRIGTVEEEMRYDVPHFAVEAGRSVQLVLENHDLMPHNLVITTPGKLREVAQAGAAAGPGGTDGKAYVPASPEVLHATGLVNAEASERLTFTAPSEPGEYPYVCTFPQHWMRMYGVMIVVPDLAAYAAAPFEPVDPIGSQRKFVQKWTVEDVLAEGDLEVALRGRSPEIGERLFNEATCALCHKQQPGRSGRVGPNLAGVLAKWKGNHAEVLREILDPSYRVDDKYRTRTILTVEGKVLSGVVVAETDEELQLIANPEATEPIVVAKDDIDREKLSEVSIMPKGLLDRYTRDEILELLAYLGSLEAETPLSQR